jgi:hypothetical protein
LVQSIAFLDTAVRIKLFCVATREASVLLTRLEYDLVLVEKRKVDDWKCNQWRKAELGGMGRH